MASTLPIGLPSRYTKRPVNFAEYAKMRGVTDFSNAAQFNLREKGYQYLFVLSIPKYIEVLCEKDTTGSVRNLTNVFCNIIEYEFKGASGFDDIQTEDLEITDNISTLNVIGKVTKQSTAEISTSYTEKSGAAITNFIKYFLEGIRDPRTQAKTYHGLIKNGYLYPGFENEIFTLLYMVTDNTMLMLEKAFLMCCAYPTQAKTSQYEGEKGSIEKVDIDISWRCFLVDGDEVDKRAVQLLAKINDQNAVSNAYKTIDDENSAHGLTNGEARAEAGKITSAPAEQRVTLDYNTYQYTGLQNMTSALQKEDMNVYAPN